MSKPMVVIVDTDENYLATLENKFLEVLDEKIELEIISDNGYFTSFFSSPKTAEIVVIDERLYTRELNRHNISNLFILTDNIESGNTEELAVTRVFKYSGIKEIFNELIYRSKDKLLGDNKESRETHVISFFSALGGSGKTSLSMGLAKSLALNHQKVLYINTESIQEFAYYLEEKSGMPNSGYRAMREDVNHIYESIKSFIRKESFYYVPPFLATLDSVNLDNSIYDKLIMGAKESKDYDFVIVDIDAGYSTEKMQLLQYADKVIMVMQQDAVSLFKTEILLNNIDLQEREKYMFICNKYEEEVENAYFNSAMQQKFPVNEYVEYISDNIKNIQQLSRLNSIQKLAYMFI